LDKLNKNQIDELLEIEKAAEEKIIHELVLIYKDQLLDLTKQVPEILGRGELDKLSKLAHRLKSSAGNLGLLQPLEICLTLETESKNQSEQDYSGIVVQLKQASDEALTELEKYIA
jgi:HPt (histidine-containing phosphotransfer) domain-containing protein